MNSNIILVTEGSIKKILLALLLIISYTKSHKNESLVYILVWTGPSPEPFGYLEWGQDAFINRNCTFQNCYLTYDREYFDDLLDYDALMFNTVSTHWGFRFPLYRSESQFYILVGLEPATFYSFDTKYNGFFNMTWTYKLNSDVPLPYIVVKNKTTGQQIGPKKEMHWMNISDMEPTDDEVISKLKNKSRAGIMIASNCNSKDRLIFAHRLKNQLAKYNKNVDIVGNCGFQLCPKPNNYICNQAIERDYYFYLAFENSFSDDYVSEKLIRGLKHYAVPVVYGGANYNRFMPDGMYLDALELGVEGLATEMNAIIGNPQRYYDFFRWRKYYDFIEEDNFTESVCGLCAVLNNQTRREERKYYRNMAKWWGQAKRSPLQFEEKERKKYGPVVGFIKSIFDFIFQ